METPVDEVGSEANGSAPRPRPRRLAILLTTAILGPPIGGLIAVAWLGVWSALNGWITDFISQLPMAPFTIVPMSYILAWQPALATAVLNALLLPFLSGRKTRLAVALATGLVVTYALTFRQYGMGFFSSATYLPSGGFLALLGGLASACCVFLVDQLTAGPVEQKA
jgi:hypothetical protein